MSESEDELDKFMSGIEKQISEESKCTKEQKNKGIRADIEEENKEEEFYKHITEAAAAAKEGDEEEYVEYDEDGIPIVVKKKEIIPLPIVDHSKIKYKSFRKNFFVEHPDISNMSASQVDEFRNSLGIKVYGANVVRPGISFGHFGFDQSLLDTIIEHGYHKPTPIQSQGISVGMSGRDVIGIAKTGSGKTAAYLLPMMIHAIDQGVVGEGEGPIGLVCTPTRELCQQVYEESCKFAKAYGLKVVAAFGGGNKYQQTKALKTGPEILIATPGRLIDLVKDDATNFQRVTYLVFDEADRMFDMGFEPQVRSIFNNTRPDKQCLLFSATFKKKIENLCRIRLTDPVRVVVGEMGEANEDILQIVHLFKSQEEKFTWLLKNLVEFTVAGSVLIFVTKKIGSEELARKLSESGHKVGLIHGDYNQFERDKVMNSFRKKEVAVLVATDVAARGIDISSIHTVLNYTVARDISTHVHRIGRTGRAGEKGVAHTLVTKEDDWFIPDLVKNLENSNQVVPEEVLAIAMKNEWFRKNRPKNHKPIDSTVSNKKTENVPDDKEDNNSTNNKKANYCDPKRINSLKKSYKLGYAKFKRSETYSSVVTPKDSSEKKSRWK